MKLTGLLTSVIVMFSLSGQAVADWTEARCDIYPAGSVEATESLYCTFAQRQGYVSVTREDGVMYKLSPVGDEPGIYHDQQGRVVIRQSGLDDQGQIFRFPDESLFVYWSTAALESVSDDDPAWFFTTRDYDDTTLLNCRAIDATGFEECQAGILRMDRGQASIVVRSQSGDQFTINFMRDYVNATNHEVDARLEGDTWIVTIDKTELYEVPVAAISGK